MLVEVHNVFYYFGVGVGDRWVRYESLFTLLFERMITFEGGGVH